MIVGGVIRNMKLHCNVYRKLNHGEGALTYHMLPEEKRGKSSAEGGGFERCSGRLKKQTPFICRFYGILTIRINCSCILVHHLHLFNLGNSCSVRPIDFKSTPTIHAGSGR